MLSKHFSNQMVVIELRHTNLLTKKFPHLSLHTIVVNNVQKHVDAEVEHAQLHSLLSSWSKSAACHNQQ